MHRSIHFVHVHTILNQGVLYTHITVVKYEIHI